jgi:hypothetical protein
VLGFKLEFIDGEPTVYCDATMRRQAARQTKRMPENVRVNVVVAEEDAPYEALKTRGCARPQGGLPRTTPMAGARSAATTATGGALAGARHVPSRPALSSAICRLGGVSHPDLSAHRQFLGALFELEGHGTQFLRPLGVSGRRELSKLLGFVS